MKNADSSSMPRLHQGFETRVSPLRPRAASSSSSTRHHHQNAGRECQSPLIHQSNRGSDRQLTESHQRWSVVVATLEERSEHENSGSSSQAARGGKNSDGLSEVELGLLEEQLRLSGREIRKIWKEYIAQKKSTFSNKISMVSNEHARAVQDGISPEQWTRGALKRKADGELLPNHYRSRLDDYGKLWSVLEMVSAIGEVI